VGDDAELVAVGIAEHDEIGVGRIWPVLVVLAGLAMAVADAVCFYPRKGDSITGTVGAFLFP
jgi:hypothetical protein